MSERITVDLGELADAKKVAKKSSSIVDRIIGEAKTNRIPSFAAARLISPASDDELACTLRINNTPTMTATNDSALMA